MPAEDNSVLYKLIESRFTVMENRFDSRFDELESRQERIEESLDALTRTIRGYDGTPGLTTQLAVLQERVDIHHAKDDNDDKRDKGNGTLHKDAVSWTFLREKAMMPIITAFVIWLLLTVLPNVINHLGLGGS